MFVAPVAFATGATVADIADTVVAEIAGIPDIIAAISYLIGVVCGIKALLKFKEHNESKGQVKISTGIILIVASAFFLGMPVLVKMGYETMGYQKAGQNIFKYEFDKQTY